MSAVLESGAAAVAPRPRRRSGGAGELWRLARADVRERVRQTGFLISMLVMVWLAHGMMPGVAAGYRTFVVNSIYRPVYSAAWVGALSATLTSAYFMFVGFYLVRGSVERDRRTGVGQILAAARVRGLRYLYAKALSNLVVLMLMAGVVLVTALIMQQVLGEDRHVDLLATITPFVLLTLPTAAFVSASAVLFDCITFLRGGVGNIAWFFLIGVLMASSGIDKQSASPFADVMAGRTVTGFAWSELHRQHPSVAIREQDVSMGLNIDSSWKHKQVLTYPLGPIPWSGEAVAARGMWLAIAILIVALSSLVFDRFDRAAAPFGRAGSPASPPKIAAMQSVPVRAARRANELTVAPRSSGFASLLRAEILLLLKGHSKWWYLGVLAALITGTFVPLKGAREFVLPIASLWPVLVWSALGHRERRDNVAPVLFSSPRPLGRLLLASWCAGTVLALVIFSPVLVRLAIAGEGAFLLGGIAGAAFIPALALASGVWTGSAKMFEALFLMLWYIGPMHHMPELDYTGVTIARPLAHTGVEFAIIAALLAVAWLGRGRRLQN
jgi:hypothetical protein